MNLIWKLLKENISKAQLIGFFVASLVGMTIVLIATQFYFDVSPVFNQKDDLTKRDFITITKRVGFLNSMSSGSTTFSPAEIEELRNSGFVKDIGKFTSSQFSVYTALNRGGARFGTEMFFESVPENFIDVKTREWRFSPTDNTIPIILPKNYLDLYNFGFAQSRSMPQISENMIGMIPLDVVISGRTESRQLRGRIVGFSSRLNTILVPEPFMEWANQTFGAGGANNPSRLILEINNIADPKIASFFKERKYEVDGENMAVSRMSSLLTVLVSVVIAIGATISLLSFVILTLSIYLLLEKNMSKLQKLRLMGYDKRTITRPYEILTVGVNFTILIFSLIAVVLIKAKYTSIIGKVLANFEPVGIQYTAIVGISIFFLISLINIYIIRKKVK